MESKQSRAHSVHTASPQTATSTSTPRNAPVITRIRAGIATKRFWVIASCAVAVAVGGIVVATHFRQQTQTATTPASSTHDAVTYQTVTPDGKPATSLGNWQRVSPKDREPAYAYIDSLDGVHISVTQQPLPEKFIEATDSQVAQLARDFNATQEIKASGVKVYVGTSAKGPQSALFIKNGLLILIKSQSKISDNAWARYAESLR